jgi:hypothetical protein
MGPRKLGSEPQSVSVAPSGWRRQGESSPGACNNRRCSRLLLVEPLARELRGPGRGASRRAVGRPISDTSSGTIRLLWFWHFRGLLGDAGEGLGCRSSIAPR